MRWLFSRPSSPHPASHRPASPDSLTENLLAAVAGARDTAVAVARNISAADFVAEAGRAEANSQLDGPVLR